MATLSRHNYVPHVSQLGCDQLDDALIRSVRFFLGTHTGSSEVARAVIATAVKELIQGRADAEEAYHFLCGDSDSNRAVLDFWCGVAGYSSDQVRSMARGWRIWWLAQGENRERTHRMLTSKKDSTND